MLFRNSSGKGESRDGGKEGKKDWKGWEIDKGCSLWLPLFFVVVPVGTRFRRLVAAGHVRGGGGGIKVPQRDLLFSHKQACR